MASESYSIIVTFFFFRNNRSTTVSPKNYFVFIDPILISMLLVSHKKKMGLFSLSENNGCFWMNEKHLIQFDTIGLSLNCHHIDCKYIVSCTEIYDNKTSPSNK